MAEKESEKKPSAFDAGQWGPDGYKPPARWDTVGGRFSLVLIAALVLSLIQFGIMTSPGQTQDGLLFLALLNPFVYIAQAAVAGFAAIKLIRWIVGRPIKDLFID
jgi:hypothetical protein